jgi:hypothetical protein
MRKTNATGLRPRASSITDLDANVFAHSKDVALSPHAHQRTPIWLTVYGCFDFDPLHFGQFVQNLQDFFVPFTHSALFLVVRYVYVHAILFGKKRSSAIWTPALFTVSTPFCLTLKVVFRSRNLCLKEKAASRSAPSVQALPGYQNHLRESFFARAPARSRTIWYLCLFAALCKNGSAGLPMSFKMTFRALP